MGSLPTWALMNGDPMNFSAVRNRVTETPPCRLTGSVDWPSQTPIPLDHPWVPSEVRRAIGMFCPRHQLYRVPAKNVIEWWLLDEAGDLLDIFWRVQKTML